MKYEVNSVADLTNSEITLILSALENGKELLEKGNLDEIAGALILEMPLDKNDNPTEKADLMEDLAYRIWNE